MLFNWLFGRKERNNEIILRKPRGIGLENDYNLHCYRVDYMGGGYSGEDVKFLAKERLVTYRTFKKYNNEEKNEKYEIKVPDWVTTKHELNIYLQENWKDLPSNILKDLSYAECDYCRGSISLYHAKFYNLTNGHSLCDNCARILYSKGFVNETNIQSITDFTQNS